MESIDSLARRLGRLERIEAATSCVTRYVRACDAGDVRALVDGVFTADAVLHVPGADFRGIDAIAAFFRDAFIVKPSMQRHFLANHTAGIVGDDEVEVCPYFLYLSSDRKTVIGCGSYRVLVVVRDGVGRMREMNIVVDVMKAVEESVDAGRP